VAGVGVSAAVIGASALLPATPRLIVWAGLAVAWIVGIVLAARNARVGLGLAPTDSLVERFGLFTIIVLGEVVLGVVAGLSAAERDATTIITGMLALGLGFGWWWIYFDLVGRRLPSGDGGALSNWVLSHLPVTLVITAVGAGMVSLIGHAHDASAPAGTGWLLAGAVATGLLGVVLTEQALVDAERRSLVFHPLRLALSAGAAAALLVGWARPAPWLLALLLVAILSAGSGSSPSAASCAPTPGANHDRHALAGRGRPRRRAARCPGEGSGGSQGISYGQALLPMNSQRGTR
jgi:low temperature requirement protein LtrA